MTIDQYNQIQIRIENLRKLDLEKIIAEIYPDQEEIGNIKISKMIVSDFLNLLKRLLSQIEMEIKGDNQIILPITISTAEYGQFNIEQVLSDLYSQISNKQLATAENSLLKLAQYSLQNGFYDKSKYKVHSNENIKLEKQKNNLDLISANYEQLKAKYDKLLTDLKNTKENLNEFYIKKQNELQQITNNLNSTNSNNTQIQGLLTSSTQSQTKINTLADQAEKDKNKIDSLKIEIDKIYTSFKNEFKSLVSEIENSDTAFKTKLENFDKKLKFVQDKTSYFDERNKHLDNLIGREVGASLFETFKQRKKELNPSLIFWRAAVMIMGILTFIMVIAIFTNFFGFFGEAPSILTWEVITVNTLKTFPFFFLLYYTIAQYNKERNFQEEYAFKSASALTIKAYSDILLNDENKDQLILKAVFNIYKSPLHNHVRGSKKDINNITDLLNEVVAKTTEVLKKKE